MKQDSKDTEQKTENEARDKAALAHLVKTRYHAFASLLRKGADGWGAFYDQSTGLLAVPITDMDRAQYPSLANDAVMVVDMHDIVFVGKRAGPPKGVLNKEK